MSALWRGAAPLVLASKSAIRASLLREAGVPVEAVPAEIDEREVERGFTGAAPAEVAERLAAAKALDVSARLPGRLVLGADQTLTLDGERFSKPATRAAGREQLARLSGRTHVLSSGAALAMDGAVLWSAVDEARLAMRRLTPAFLDAYLEAAGEGVLTSVGGYQFEGVGAHLFEALEGDFRTVLGLPLLPVLAALRDLDRVAA